MIPAILSAVFVIYLYRKLASEAEGPADDERAAPADASSLVSRIEGLEARLERLANRGGRDS